MSFSAAIVMMARAHTHVKNEVRVEGYEVEESRVQGLSSEYFGSAHTHVLKSLSRDSEQFPLRLRELLQPRV